MFRRSLANAGQWLIWSTRNTNFTWENESNFDLWVKVAQRLLHSITCQCPQIRKIGLNIANVMSCWEDIPIIFKKYDKALFRAKSSGFSSFMTLISRILSRTGLQVSLVFTSKSDHPWFSPHNMSPTKQVTGLCTLILPAFLHLTNAKARKKIQNIFFSSAPKKA